MNRPKLKRTSLLIVLLLFSITVAAEKIPDSAFQMGTLRSVTSDAHSRVVGVYNSGQGVLGEQIRIVTRYTIESSQYIYQADRTTNRHDKPLNLTINGPIKFAVIGTDFYVYDDTGKVHKMLIATKTLKTESVSK